MTAAGNAGGVAAVVNPMHRPKGRFMGAERHDNAPTSETLGRGSVEIR